MQLVPHIVVAVIPAWVLVKTGVQKFMATNPATTIQALKEEIWCCNIEIQLRLCQSVIKNFVKITRVSQQSRGGYSQDEFSIHNSHVFALWLNQNFGIFSKTFFLIFTFSALVGTLFIFYVVRLQMVNYTIIADTAVKKNGKKRWHLFMLTKQHIMHLLLLMRLQISTKFLYKNRWY